MLVRPIKPAAGLSIRNAFQIVMLEKLGDDHYASSYREIVRQIHLDFSRHDLKKMSDDPDEPIEGAQKSDSVRLTNSAGETARIELSPLVDTNLYEEFEVRALGIEVELGVPNPKSKDSEFRRELIELAKGMNRRIALWLEKKAA